MNLPSFAEFKRNQNAFYAFATILALIFIFSLWVKDTNYEKKRLEQSLKDCAKDKKQSDSLQDKKVDELQEKLLIIVQKQSIKDSIK